jgi:hypothetical protein
MSAQIRFGKRYGNTEKMPDGGKREGKFLDGSAK